MHLTADDKICVPVPLYHCFGMVLGCLAAMNFGSSMVLPSAAFKPEPALLAAAEERCTAL